MNISSQYQWRPTAQFISETHFPCFCHKHAVTVTDGGGEAIHPRWLVFLHLLMELTNSASSQGGGDHLNSRSVCIFLPCLVYIPEFSLIPRQVPDFNEQTRVSNGHPGCNSRIYPRFLPQLEKTHETFPSLRDEARFPCIVSRAIAFSQSNT